MNSSMCSPIQSLIHGMTSTKKTLSTCLTSASETESNKPEENLRPVIAYRAISIGCAGNSTNKKTSTQRRGENLALSYPTNAVDTLASNG
jgi:hypothetical protein